MKKKQRFFSKEWFSSFSANIAGVIIGIVLTFGITFYVQHRQDRKQMREMVTLLKREIQDNKNWLEGRAKEWNKDFEAYWVVKWKQDWDTIPYDTLQARANHMRKMSVYYSASYIWNVFQSSGMVQKLHNTELVSVLSESYFWAEDMREWWKQYNEGKQAVSDIFGAQYSERPLDYFEALLADKAARKFIDNVAVHNVYNFPDFYKTFAPLYDYTLFLLDNYDKPRKTRGISFSMYLKMQQEKTNPEKK